MPHTVIGKPLDLLKFVAVENEHFMISLAKDGKAVRAISHIQGRLPGVLSESCTIFGRESADSPVLGYRP